MMVENESKKDYDSKYIVLELRILFLTDEIRMTNNDRQQEKKQLREYDMS